MVNGFGLHYNQPARDARVNVKGPIASCEIMWGGGIGLPPYPPPKVSIRLYPTHAN